MNVRLSSYNIYLDTDEQRKQLVLSGMTGESLRIEEDILNAFSRNGIRPLEPRFHGDERIAQLLRSGIITDSTSEEELAAFRSMVANRHANALRMSPAYTFILSMDCNFGCVYCYQSQKPACENTGTTFTPEMIDTFFGCIPALEEGLNLPANGIRGYSFIGGEPLLKRHKPLITRIMQLARGLGTAAISAISNAYNLDFYKDLLGPEGISSIQVTVDGPAEVHNLRRPTRTGEGTFVKIADNIDLALSRGVRTSLRVNVDCENLASLPALAREIKARLWHENELFGVYLGLVHGEFVRDRLINTSAVLDFIEENRDACPELDIFSLSEVDTISKLKDMQNMNKSLITAFKETYCSAHHNNIMIDARGRIYTCLETDQSDDYLIGTISRQGVLNWSDKGRSHWMDRTIANISECSGCPYALFCGGGCAVRAREKGSHIYSPDCHDFKELFHRVFQL